MTSPATYKELQSQIAQLQTQIGQLQEQANAVRKTEHRELIATIRAQMATYDITMEDLGGISRKSKTEVKKKVLAKYRDPKTGKSWSGHGRAPHWVIGDRTQYLIT